MTITYVPLTGHVQTPTGQPGRQATVTLQPNAAMIDPGTRMVLPERVAVVADDNGDLPTTGPDAVLLAACDDPGVQPDGLGYRVEIHYPGAKTVTLTLFVPHTASSVDIADAVPGPPPQSSVPFATAAELAAGVATAKAYTDAQLAGKTVKDDVRAATTANITLTGLPTIDSVVLAAGDRVLVKNQTAGAENGIYLAASGAWARSPDADSGAELLGAAVLVRAGGQALTLWAVTNDAPIVLGTTAVTWGPASSGGGGGAGAELLANKDQPSGYPGLDLAGKLKLPEFPTSVARYDVVGAWLAKQNVSADLALKASMWVDVTHDDFGGPVAGNWRVAVQAAADYAAANNLPLHFPAAPSSPGYFYIEFDSTHTSILVSTEVFGVGRASHIKVGPERPTFVTRLFDLAKTGVRKVHDLWLEGPTDPGDPVFDGGGHLIGYGPVGTNGKPSTGPTAIRILANPASVRHSLNGSMASGSFDLFAPGIGFVSTDVGKAVDVESDDFDLSTTIATFIDSGHVTLTDPAPADGVGLEVTVTVTNPGGSTPTSPDPDARIWNVDITGMWKQGFEVAAGNYRTYLSGVDAHSWSNNTCGGADGQKKAIYIANSVFHGDPTIFVNLLHHWYINPNVSISFDHVSFYDRHGSSSYVVHHFGHANDAPDFVEYSDVYVDGSCDNGMLVGVNATRTEFTNCVLAASVNAIVCRGVGFKVNGGTITGRVKGPAASSSATCDVTITGTKFEGPDAGITMAGGPDSVWRFNGITAKSTTQLSGSFLDDGNANGTFDVFIEGGCEFNLNASVGAPVLFRWGKTRVYWTGGKVKGDYSGSGVILPAGVITGAMHLVDVRFQQTGGVTVASANLTGLDGAIHGAECEVSNPSGIVGLPQAFSAIHLDFQPRKRISPTALAAAATLNPNLNYDTYPLTGTATITDIKPYGNTSAARCIQGPYHLIPDGNQTFTSSATLKLRAGTSGIARTADTVVTFVGVWDSTSGVVIWHETTGVPADHKTRHQPGAGDALDYTLVNLVGTLAGRPAAAAANNGLYYFATDDNGGTVYRSNGTTWVKAARGATETIPGGNTVATDPIWDAVGDLAIGSGADTAAKLTVGPDGSVLTADSTISGVGLKYKLPTRSVADIRSTVNVVNTTTNTAIVTLAVPSTVVSGDIVRLRAVGDIFNNSSGSVTFTFQVKIGTTTLRSSNGVASTASANRRPWFADIYMLVVSPSGSPSQLFGILMGLNASSSTVLNLGTPNLGSASGTATQDLTAAPNLVINVQMSVADALAEANCYSATLEVSKR
jgi:hypothetical protein